MMTKMFISSGVLIFAGFLSIAIGVCYAMAPDGGGKKASGFLSVGFASSMIGILTGLAGLVTLLCRASFT